MSDAAAVLKQQRASWQQTMLRIKDPKVSVPFYERHFGMKLVHRYDFPQAPQPTELPAPLTRPLSPCPLPAVEVFALFSRAAARRRRRSAALAGHEGVCAGSRLTEIENLC